MSSRLPGHEALERNRVRLTGVLNPGPIEAMRTSQTGFEFGHRQVCLTGVLNPGPIEASEQSAVTSLTGVETGPH